MGALLPIVLSLAPMLARWLGGTDAEAVAAKAGAVIRSVVGSDDPAALEAAAADPQKAAELRLQLAQVAAEAEKAERKAELDTLRAELADVADARHQTVTLAQAGSPLAWGAPIVTLAVLGLFGGTMYALFRGAVPEGQMAMILCGAIAAWGGQAVSYWLGTSAASRAKDATIAQATQDLARSAPVGPVTWGR